MSDDEKRKTDVDDMPADGPFDRQPDPLDRDPLAEDEERRLKAIGGDYNEALSRIKSMTYEEVKEVFNTVARKHLRALEKIADKRPLKPAEADDVRRIREYFHITEARVSVSAAEVQTVEKAPIPADIWKRRRILFPAKSTPKKKTVWATIPETGEKYVSFTAEYGGKIITHRGIVPADVEEKDLPKFGELTDRIYKASVFFQKAQIQKTDSVAWPYVSKAELLRALKFSEDRIENPGKLSKLIDSAFMTLAFFTYEIKDKKTGEVESVAHILDWRRDLAGRGFYFKLNDDHTGLILALMRGERPGRHYIGYPQALLADVPKERRGIFEELVSLAGLKRPHPVFIRTILTKWAGLSIAEAKKKSSAGIDQFLVPIFKEAIERDLIAGYNVEKKSMSNPNRLECKIEFSMPRRKKHHDVDADLLAAMMETWGPEASLFEAGDELEKRRAAKRRQFAATIGKHGPATIRRHFDQAKADPEGEALFWRLVEDSDDGGKV